MFKKCFIILFLIFFYGLVFSQKAGTSRPITKKEKEIKQLEAQLSALESRVKYLESVIEKLNTSTPATLSNQTAINPPSNYDIESAITEILKKKVPVKWSGSLMGGRNAKVRSIEIISIGVYNNRVGYWPVKALVNGTCEAQFIGETKLNSFNEVGNFKIYKDDYGSWKADIDVY